MKIVLVSKCSLDNEQYVEFKMSFLISPSKGLISLCWVTYICRTRFADFQIFIKFSMRLTPYEVGTKSVT